MQIQPYLFFNGRCDEAIAFYRQALGAEVVMRMCFQDNPDPQPPGVLPPNWEEKVMHASLRIGETTVLLSDGHCLGGASFQGFSLSLTVPAVGDAQKLFAALSAGGEVEMPLGKTFFSPMFGMLADRFGVAWIIYVKP